MSELTFIERLKIWVLIQSEMLKQNGFFKMELIAEMRRNKFYQKFFFNNFQSFNSDK